MRMSDDPDFHNLYPYNLFWDVKGKSDIKFPDFLSSDTLSGLRYVLSELSEAEQLFVQLFYANGISADKISVQLGIPLDQLDNTKKLLLKKLRKPSRWKYIQYGIAGFLQKESNNQYQRGFLAGYAAGYQACTNDSINGCYHPPFDEDIMNLPLEALNLSSRAYNIFRSKEYPRIRDIVSLDADSIHAMRNLGVKTADEIARALQIAGVRIEHTAWHQYLL